MSYFTFQKAQELIAKETKAPEAKLEHVAYDFPFPGQTFCYKCDDSMYRKTIVMMDRKITLFAHPAPGGTIYKRVVMVGKCSVCGYYHWAWHSNEWRVPRIVGADGQDIKAFYHE